MIALRSAQQGGLKIPKDVMPKMSKYLDSVQTDKKGSGYRYMPNDRITDAMVAEGLLCRIYTSWNSKRPGLGPVLSICRHIRHNQAVNFTIGTTQLRSCIIMAASPGRNGIL